MGTWRTKLYEDDVALDVKDMYTEDLRKGKDNETVTAELIKKWGDSVDDVDDGPIFWFALADTQWNLGRLLPHVKRNALAWIDKGTDLDRWAYESEKKAQARAEVIEALKEKLNSPMPPEKKIRQYRLYKCQWQLGDVFAYRLESDMAKEKGVFGRYMLVQKVDEGTWAPGHVVPVVRVKLTPDENLPTNTSDFDKMEYVQTFVFKKLAPLEELVKKGDLKPEMVEIIKQDDYFIRKGFIPCFKAVLINSSKRIIPKKLIFCGNFENVRLPEVEYDWGKGRQPALSWNRFENTLISDYFGFNHRQYVRFQQDNE